MGEDLGALPQTPPKPFLEERFRNPKNFPEKGIPPTNGLRNLSGASVGGMPFSGKVLGVLRPFFQEGSEQGLGRSPKVFPLAVIPPYRKPFGEAGGVEAEVCGDLGGGEVIGFLGGVTAMVDDEG